MKASSLPVTIRLAQLDDLALCLEIDTSYVSDEVWQMYLEPGAGPQGVAVRFRATRLPRAMTVQYPRDRDELWGNWQQQDCFLVAFLEQVIQDPTTGEESIAERIVGYIDLHEQRWQRAGWVQNLVIDAP